MQHRLPTNLITTHSPTGFPGENFAYCKFCPFVNSPLTISR